MLHIAIQTEQKVRDLVLSLGADHLSSLYLTPSNEDIPQSDNLLEPLPPPKLKSNFSSSEIEMLIMEMQSLDMPITLPPSSAIINRNTTPPSSKLNQPTQRNPTPTITKLNKKDDRNPTPPSYRLNLITNRNTAPPTKNLIYSRNPTPPGEINEGNRGHFNRKIRLGPVVRT